MRRFARFAVSAFMMASLAVTTIMATSIRRVERVPPVGWETRITPGFDPPIEYFIAYGQYGFESVTPEKRKEVVEQWGPNALGVLKQLAEDPGWSAFRGDILSLIPLVKSPATTALLVEEAEKQMSKSDPAKQGADLHNALARLAGADVTAYLELLDAHFAAAPAEVQRVMVSVLAYRLRGDRGAECEARLTEIARTTADDGIRKTIADAIEVNNSRKRADEPMQAILDTERAGKVTP